MLLHKGNVINKGVHTELDELREIQDSGKDYLDKMLERENRLMLYNSCIEFLKTRIKLDQSGFTEDIFQH